MSVFFNGRMFETPTSQSAVNDSALANRNLTVGNNLAIIGASVGGKPNTPLVFGSASEAKAALVSGELLDAITKAFDPSAQTGGPASVTAIRVNPATQSTLTLKDASAADAIVLTSTDYGAYTAQIKQKVESGTSAGSKLTTQFGDAYYSADNIARNAFSIQYTGGQASAQATINGTTVTLQAPTGTTVATIDLNQYPTIQALVDRINVVSGFAAAVLDGNGTQVALNGLDYITAQDVKTALFTVTANLQAQVDWFNSAGEGYVTAARAAGAGKPAANIAFTYLAGGSDGTITNAEWSNAFTTLQGADVQWLVALSSNSAIHAMADSHAAFMSNIGKSERRNFSGLADGSSDSAALTAAKALNSDRTALLHVGYYDYDPASATGALKLYPPYMLAALVAGMHAGSSPGTASTNKSMKVRGLERLVRNPTDTDVLIRGGVLCVESTPQGYKVVKSNTTWVTNRNYNRVEVSTGSALDYTVRSIRDALDVLRGEKNLPILLSRALQITKSTCELLAKDEPIGPAVLAGDENSPAFKNIQASIDGDVLRVQLQASPVIPNNFVLTTVYAVPYSGTATSAAA